MSRIQSYSPDIEHLKDIPGYQPILKSVLKSQIQFLVEQLSEQTGEESVLLTASITDGTLTHIGSSCGKVFLQDNEEFKSKFLGFCLKQQSKRKPEITSIPEESTTSSKRRRKNNEQTYPISIHKVNPSAQNVGSSTFRPFRTETITTDPHENFQTESREVDITSNKCTKEEIRTANETIQSCDFVVQKNVGYTDYSDQASIDKNVFQSNEAEDNEPNIVIKQEPIDSDTSLSSTAFTHGLTGSSWSSEKDACVSERPNRQDRQKPSSSKTQQLEDETQEGLLKKTSVSSLEQFGDVSQPSLNTALSDYYLREVLTQISTKNAHLTELNVDQTGIPIASPATGLPTAIPITDKPYRCHLCGRGFTQRGNLEVHMWTQHGNK